MKKSIISRELFEEYLSEEIERWKTIKEMLERKEIKQIIEFVTDNLDQPSGCCKIANFPLLVEKGQASKCRRCPFILLSHIRRNCKNKTLPSMNCVCIIDKIYKLVVTDKIHSWFGVGVIPFNNIVVILLKNLQNYTYEAYVKEKRRHMY